MIGDTAHAAGPGGPLPGVASVARQQGIYVARVIAARIAGEDRRRHFAIVNMATSNDRPPRRDRGFRMDQVLGTPGWLLWSSRTFILDRLSSARARRVEWFWAYVTIPARPRLIHRRRPLIIAVAELQHKLHAVVRITSARYRRSCSGSSSRRYANGWPAKSRDRKAQAGRATPLARSAPRLGKFLKSRRNALMATRYRFDAPASE